MAVLDPWPQALAPQPSGLMTIDSDSTDAFDRRVLHINDVCSILIGHLASIFFFSCVSA